MKVSIPFPPHPFVPLSPSSSTSQLRFPLPSHPSLYLQGGSKSGGSKNATADPSQRSIASFFKAPRTAPTKQSTPPSSSGPPPPPGPGPAPSKPSITKPVAPLADQSNTRGAEGTGLRAAGVASIGGAAAAVETARAAAALGPRRAQDKPQQPTAASTLLTKCVCYYYFY